MLLRVLTSLYLQKIFDESAFQYSCVENPVDRGTWWPIVHGVAKSQTRLEGQHRAAQEESLQSNVWVNNKIKIFAIKTQSQNHQLDIPILTLHWDFISANGG